MLESLHLVVLIDCDTEGATIRHNVSRHLPNHTMLYTGTSEFFLLWHVLRIEYSVIICIKSLVFGQRACNGVMRVATCIYIFEMIVADMLQTVWNELDYRVDVCRITKGAHIEHL